MIDTIDDKFIVDLPDRETTEILTERWSNTARLLDLKIATDIIKFGNDKWQWKAHLRGSKADVNTFMKFVDDTLELLKEYEKDQDN